MNNLCVVSDTIREILKTNFKLQIVDIFNNAFGSDKYIKIIQTNGMQCTIRHSKTRFNRNENKEFEDYIIHKIKKEIIKKLRLTNTETKIEFEKEFNIDFHDVYENIDIFKILIEITRTENNVTLISL